ncbi:hypothetical protein ANN_15882 [Periplaneta americana]|uniref:Uncharacterized protein n=1 Tax=Periplaneta americana TaxID=6978 RepID=A0ABQ8SHG2_PERAM|nr:hypothetical protein ANN_15882 [Periplaneta americana]
MAATLNERDVDLEVEQVWEQGCASLVPDKSRARRLSGPRGHSGKFGNGKNLDTLYRSMMLTTPPHSSIEVSPLWSKG